MTLVYIRLYATYLDCTLFSECSYHYNYQYRYDCHNLLPRAIICYCEYQLSEYTNSLTTTVVCDTQ